MSETNIPARNLPDVPADFTYEMAGYIDHIRTPAETTIPGFVIRASGLHDLPGLSRAETVGGRVEGALRYRDIYTPTVHKQGIARTVSTPDHLDGIDIGGPFMQIHANGPTVRAAVGLTVRRLTPDTQEVLGGAVRGTERADDYTKQAFIADLPDAVSKYAPVVARYRAFLDPFDTVVFRNGFDASRISEQDKFLTSHSFTSVDADGNPTQEARQATVHVIRFPSSRAAGTEHVQRRGLFGRRKRIA